ncbi:MAG: transcriptional activator RfaH [Henriciella sp.]|nr:transcriptional activator RfaH [Henriciella sp.]
MTKSGTAWFAVQTHGGKEALVITNLERQGYEAWCPMIAKQVKQGRSRRRVLRPLFPRYVFVRIDLTEQRWKPIDSTFGVSGILKIGMSPAALPDGVVNRLIDLTNEDGAVAFSDTLVPGDRVKVVSGSFDDWIGQVVELPEQNRVVLLLRMAHRSVPVTVPASNVIRVA